jgi:hypothetical protein
VRWASVGVARRAAPVASAAALQERRDKPASAAAAPAAGHTPRTAGYVARGSRAWGAPTASARALTVLAGRVGAVVDGLSDDLEVL